MMVEDDEVAASPAQETSMFYWTASASTSHRRKPTRKQAGTRKTAAGPVAWTTDDPSYDYTFSVPEGTLRVVNVIGGWLWQILDHPGRILFQGGRPGGTDASAFDAVDGFDNPEDAQRFVVAQYIQKLKAGQLGLPTRKQAQGDWGEYGNWDTHEASLWLWNTYDVYQQIEAGQITSAADVRRAVMAAGPGVDAGAVNWDLLYGEVQEHMAELQAHGSHRQPTRKQAAMEYTAWGCTDCAMFVANGEPPLRDPETGLDWSQAEEEAWVQEWANENRGIIWSLGDDEDDFSWRPCDLCGTALGGARHEFYGFDRG